MNPEWQAQLALLPDYLGNHLLLTLTSLGLGLALSLPLAFAVVGRPRRQALVLGIASAVQTIPGLALLALMVPLLRTIGFLPALIALTLYSMLPVLRNTVTGIGDIDPDLVEAGRGIGMTERQLLWRVRLPLALPVIVAGIRTATVWVVGMATLSTPVGATSLGNYIFSGLQTRNTIAVVVGCIAAALLALALDALIRLIESGLVLRRRRRVALGLAGVLGLLAAGLAPLASGPARADAVVVGAKTFTEQYLLAELVTSRLTAANIPARRLDSLGSTVVFDALVSGRVDCYVEYSGTLWANAMGRSGNPGRAAVAAEVRAWLAAEHGIDTVIELGFENAYALAVRRADAERLGLRAVADLAPLAGGWKLGSDYEFFARPEWASLQLAYGLDFAERISMDSSLMYEALAAGEVDVITAFSTDGRIDAYDLVVLEDTRSAFPPYDALLLVHPAAAARPGLRDALDGLAGSIDAAAMRRANRAVDLDGLTIEQAARLLE